MTKENEVKKKTQSLFYKTWMALVIAIVVSVIWHSIEWTRLGYSQMYLNLDYQISMFAKDIIKRQPFMLEKFLRLENRLEANALSVTKPILLQEEKVVDHYNIKDHRFKYGVAQLGLFFRKAWNVAKLSFLLVCIKFISIISSILLFAFAVFLGALDGLRRRYIRTVEAGRESTYLYHNISTLFRQVPVLFVLMYLLAPISISATVVILMISLGLFIYSNLFFSTLKKFL